MEGCGDGAAARPGAAAPTEAPADSTEEPAVQPRLAVAEAAAER